MSISAELAAAEVMAARIIGELDSFPRQWRHLVWERIDAHFCRHCKDELHGERCHCTWDE